MNIEFLNNELVKNRILVSVYVYNNDPSVFMVGYIKKAFEDAILLEVIRQDGNYDGYMIINLNDICQIEYKTHYLNNLNIVNSKRKSFDIKNFKEYLLNDFIKFCLDNEMVIEVENIDLSIIGKIVYNEQDFLIVNKINTEIGCFDGNIILRVDDIKNISFGGIRQQKYEKDMLRY